MPDYFVPHADSPEQAERVRAAVVQFARDNGYSPNEERRILSLAYTHDGTDYVAEVDQVEPRTGEQVIMILDAGSVYLVCTPNRGVARGTPILVGRTEVRTGVDFD